MTSIGFKDPSSVMRAAEELIKAAKNQKAECRENLIFIFRQYYLNCLDQYKSEIDDSLADETILRKASDSIPKIGWTVKATEGSFYIGESGGWIETKFKNILTETYRTYLQMRSKEIKEGFSEDAGLLISWEQLGERIVGWESFLNKYPHFTEKDSIQDYLNIYLRVFLSGMDNSQIEDEKGALEKEVQAAYEKFIKEHEKSRYYKVVKEYYDMLKRNHFIVPKDVGSYLESKGYKPFWATQPPNY